MLKRSAIFLVISLPSLLAAQETLARWKAEYASRSPEVRQWFASAELTPKAQQRFKFKSCCEQSDVVKTKFKVN